MTRTFTHSKATRSGVWLLLGIVGESGSGKTLSALKLAEGIRRVTGGKIFFLDSEENRAKHYAPEEGQKADPKKGTFDFTHVPFDPPFSPDDYLAAFRHCIDSGANVVIVDSFSHEHDGPGGVLEWHEKELDRMLANAERKGWKNVNREKYNFPAWSKPKASRRRLKTEMERMPCHFILCFRAKEQIKPTKNDKGRDEMVDLGWMPIGGKEYLFAMTLRALLPENAGGVPVFSPQRPGERAVYKLPLYFDHIFRQPHAFCEADGEAMAKWAAGAKKKPPPPPKPADDRTRFGAKLAWDGKTKWAGKPVEDADPLTIRMYLGALEGAAAKSKSEKAHKAIAAHAAAVTEVLETKEGSDNAEN